MNLEQVKNLNIPRSPGCYQFLNSKKEIIYVGKAVDLKNRVLSYWQKSTTHSPAKYSMMKQIEQVKWIETDSEIEALLLEANLVKKFQPTYNVMLRDDKRFLYIKISTEDEIPGVFMTRKVTKSGKFFGPFVSVLPVKQTLKVIRKIWPYCTMRRRQLKPCFYYQIGRCTGVCGGIISAKDYQEKIIKPLTLFFEGKKDRIVKDLIKEMKAKEKAGDVEGAARISYTLKNMQTVLRNAEVISVADKYAADVVELAKVLELPKKPGRIEGYDISNIFGKEATGSMVVFMEGEPEKNEYRKFKIRSERDFINDVDMLRQVLERRFKHSGEITNYKLQITNENSESNADEKKYNWAMPDLIIIDGGKGQLNAAVKVLKKFKLDIPVIAISKGAGLRSARAQDKLFFPGEKKPLELPLASPALHLVKRVRDEAHRFAIGYHRLLRKKKTYQKRLLN